MVKPFLFWCHSLFVAVMKICVVGKLIKDRVFCMSGVLDVCTVRFEDVKKRVQCGVESSFPILSGAYDDQDDLFIRLAS